MNTQAEITPGRLVSFVFTGSWLRILILRADNILLTGFIHGLSDYHLVGMSSQMMPVILVGAIAFAGVITQLRLDIVPVDIQTLNIHR